LPFGTSEAASFFLRFTYSCQRAGTFCKKLSYSFLTVSWSNICLEVPAAAAHSESSASVSDSDSRSFRCQVGSEDKKSASSLTGSWGFKAIPLERNVDPKSPRGQLPSAYRSVRRSNPRCNKAQHFTPDRLRGQVNKILRNGQFVGIVSPTQGATILVHAQT
jgi:hypothetical protein